MSKCKKITRKRKSFRRRGRRGGTTISSRRLSSRGPPTLRGPQDGTHANGDTYDGVFIDGNMVSGKITRGYSGIIDEGIFVNKRLTEGTRTYPDGIVDKGVFNGPLIEGTKTHPNGIIINVSADENQGRSY